MPAKLRDDEDFNNFGKTHPISPNNHYVDRHLPSTPEHMPSDMKPFALSPEQSAIYFFKKKFNFESTSRSRIAPYTCYLSVNEGFITYTLIKTTGGPITAVTTIKAPRSLDPKTLSEGTKRKILDIALEAKHISPPQLTTYEGIGCNTTTLTQANRFDFNIAEGQIGKILVQGLPAFISPGNHILPAGCTFVGSVTTNTNIISHNGLHVVTVKPGELYYVKSPLLGDDDFILLTPGRHVFELPNATILPVQDAQSLEIKVDGRILFEKIPQGKAGVHFMKIDGQSILTILSPGVTYISPDSKFLGRISSKNRIIEVELQNVLTRDGVRVDVKVDLDYRIVSPYYSVIQLAMNGNLNNKILPIMKDGKEVMDVEAIIERRIETEAKTAMERQIASTVSIKRRDNKLEASVYDALFNTEVVKALNRIVGASAEVEGHTVVNSVMIVSIKPSDKQVALQLETEMAAAILRESENRTRIALEPLQPKMQEQARLLAAKKAELERLTAQLQQIQARGKQAVEQTKTLKAQAVAQIVRDNPVALEIMNADAAMLDEATKDRESFFYHDDADENLNQASSYLRVK